jgi:hypothetical protein
MNEVFYPSLLISLGPSSKKALEYSKNQLSSLPEHFRNLIEYYDITDAGKLAGDLQNIVDKKLLSAKYINKLVDAGYKVRSEIVSSIKINIYFFWDVHNSDISSGEVIKTLAQLNYGNLDKEQHTGAAIFTIAIMEGELGQDKNNSTNAGDKLRKVVEYLSQESTLLSIDSKLYLLNCISRDGTRVSKQELEYIAALTVHMNVIPSKEPVLSNFNRRIMMHERGYKVGTIGFSSISLRKDRLVKDFSRFMSRDILKYACENEEGSDYSSSEAYKLLQEDEMSSFLLKEIHGSKDDELFPEENKRGIYRIFHIDKDSYIQEFSRQENFYNEKCDTEYKEMIHKNSAANKERIIETIGSELNDIISRSGIREGQRYLKLLEEQLHKERHQGLDRGKNDVEQYAAEFSDRIDKYPDLTVLTIKLAVLAWFLFYAVVNLMFPLLGINLRIAVGIVYFAAFFSAMAVYYKGLEKKLNNYLDGYGEAISSQKEQWLNNYIKGVISEDKKALLAYVNSKQEVLKCCIENLMNIYKGIEEEEIQEEMLGELASDLIDPQERYNFYRSSVPEISYKYASFTSSLSGYEDYLEPDFQNKLQKYASGTAESCANIDFYDYMTERFKVAFNKEIERWVDTYAVKAKYLLQYPYNNYLEEHSFFIASEQVYNDYKPLLKEGLNGFNAIIIKDDLICFKGMYIVKTCLGIDLEKIISLKKPVRSEKYA